MRLLRHVMKREAFRPLVPLVYALDAALLCARHQPSGRRARAKLRGASCHGAAEMLRALNSARPNPAIERQRRRLLTCRNELGHESTYHDTWTVSRAAAISKAPRQAGIIAAIVREFSPEQTIELGTNIGISAAYMALATPGQVTTLEGSGARVAVARELHQRLSIQNIRCVEGMFDDTLQPTLDHMPTVDLAFIDGNHEHDATIKYYNAIAQHASSEAVFIFDDVRLDSGMNQAWIEICKDPRIGLIVDLWTMGVCVHGKAERAPVITEPIACF